MLKELSRSYIKTYEDNQGYGQTRRRPKGGGYKKDKNK